MWFGLRKVSSREKLFLSSERVAHFASINPRTLIPHVVPVCFVFDGENLFSVIGTETARLRNMEGGSSVALVIDRYVEENDYLKGWGMLITGKPETISHNKDRERFMHGWKLLIEKYHEYVKYANADLSPKDPDKILLMMHPTSVVSWGLEEGD